MNSARKIFFILFIIQAFNIHAQNNSYNYYHFTGMIGKKMDVTADLCFENDTIISGYYYYNTFGIPITLQGSVKDKKNIIIYESDRDYDHTGEIRASFQDDGSIRGTFRNLKTKKKFSLTLEVNETRETGSMALNGYTVKESKDLFNLKNSPSCSIDYCILLPGSTTNLLIADSINHSIYIVFFGSDFSGTPEQKLKIYSDSVMLSYMTNNADTSGYGSVPFFLNWEFANKMKVKSNSNYLLSLEFSTYFYTGGAHGGYGSLFRNFDMKTGKTITLDDIFIKGSDDNLKTILNKAIRKTYEAGPDVKLTDIGFFSDSVDITQNFYITTKGIGFFFNPYDVACYAMGTVDIFVPFSSISAIMNEDFIKRISDQQEY